MSNTAENEGKWYVIHTYSGYENKVLENIKSTVENMSLQEKIFDVCIPYEEVVEIKNDKRKTVQHKLFPSYVMVKMILTKQTLYIIRNIRGVTGFVGPGADQPVPLTNEEVRRMGIENVRVKTDVCVGDTIDIVDGPFDTFQGTVEEVDTVHQKVKARIVVFNRDTTVELDFIQVRKSQ